MILAFDQLDGWNSGLARVCSFFGTVLASCRSVPGKTKAGCWIRVVRRGRSHIYPSTRNQKLTYEHTAWRFLRRRYRLDREIPVRYLSAGVEVDYAPLLLKSIEDELIALVTLRKKAKELGYPRPVYLGRLVWPGEKPRRGARLISAIRRTLLWMEETVNALTSLALQWTRLATAFLSARRNPPPVHALWLGVCTNEYGRHGQKRAFYWPDRAQSSLKILYCLPRSPNAEYQRVLREEGVEWISQFHILQHCTKSQLVRIAGKLAWIAATLALPWKGSHVLRARLCGFHFDSIVWAEWHRAVPVRAALSNCSAWSSTRPPLAALRSRGVKTALWNYSADAIPFHVAGPNPDHHQGLHRSVHEAERIYLWNPFFTEWTRRNMAHNPRNKCVTVGPTMFGNPAICLAPPGPLDGRFRIGVFDITNVSGKSKKVIEAVILPEEYNAAFWADMRKLASDFPEAVLVLKPKKSFDCHDRSYPQTFWDLWNDSRLRAEGRIELIADDADSYLAIGRSDVTVGMPFTSPCFAAWHFLRAGIFYDPAGMVVSHLYGGFGRYFCRSYADLKALIVEAQERKKRGETLKVPGSIEPYIGPRPAEDPQAVLFDDLTHWIFPRSQRSNPKTEGQVPLTV